MDSFACRKCTYSLTLVGAGEYQDSEGHVVCVRSRDGRTVPPPSRDAVCPRCGRQGSIQRLKSETDLGRERRKGCLYPAAVTISILLVLLFFLTWVGCPPRM